MTTCLVRHARLLVTMDRARREIADGGVWIRDGVIEQVGKTADLPKTADHIIEARDHLVMPGLVNTHHHVFQALTRATPGAQDANLFDWLCYHYPIWARLTPEMLFTSAQLALAELMLSGCTTAADHHYLYPPGVQLDDEIAAARELGVRFYALRGSMSVGKS
ncbi:MAG: amidohydrolase family protein, partial [Chloroflexi bacterium]|nr:amidohydrolase family protein [Chloroflexota bacterium]